jgi:hypothetical protein
MFDLVLTKMANGTGKPLRMQIRKDRVERAAQYISQTARLREMMLLAQSCPSITKVADNYESHDDYPIPGMTKKLFFTKKQPKV